MTGVVFRARGRDSRHYRDRGSRKDKGKGMKDAGTSTFRELSKRRNEHQIGWSVFRYICWVKHVGSRARNPTSRVLLGGALLFSEDRRRSQKSCEPEDYL